VAALLWEGFHGCGPGNAGMETCSGWDGMLQAKALTGFAGDGGGALERRSPCWVRHLGDPSLAARGSLGENLI
jgi:hypothetical protein